MRETILLLIDINGKVVASYKSKDLVKKLLPAIEAKLLTNIETIKEILVNPTVDLVGNENFIKTYTVKEFLETLA